MRGPSKPRPSSSTGSATSRSGSAAYVGSPETVARKIAANLRALGANRFDLKYGMVGMTHEALMTNIELYGRQVIPRVRELLAPAAGASGHRTAAVESAPG